MKTLEKIKQKEIIMKACKVALDRYKTIFDNLEDEEKYAIIKLIKEIDFYEERMGG